MNDYLQHYGTKGQKWGVRNYQNPDGSLTPEGKERYFGSHPGSLTDRFVKGVKAGSGITGDESTGKKVAKVAANALTSLLPTPLAFVGRGFLQQNLTNKRYSEINNGEHEDMGKSWCKSVLFGSQGSVYYNLARKNGSGKVGAAAKAMGGSIADMFTLGKYGYNVNKKNNISQKQF